MRGCWALLALAGCSSVPLELGSSRASSLSECTTTPEANQQLLRCRNRELGVRSGVRGSLREAFAQWAEAVRQRAPVSLSAREVDLLLDGTHHPALRFDVVDADSVRQFGYFLLAGQRWVWCATNEPSTRALNECRDDLATAVRHPEIDQPARI